MLPVSRELDNGYRPRIRLGQPRVTAVRGWGVADRIAVALTIVGATATGGLWLVSQLQARPATPKVVTVETHAPSPGAPTTIVFEIDVTASVPLKFTHAAQRAFAASVPRLVHDGQGPVRIYVRVISHSSGSDAAALATYTIPGVPNCANPFDLRCKQRHAAALAGARSRAREISHAIARLRLARTHTGTALRSAFAAAGELLRGTEGARWLVAATDLRPSNEPASTVTVDLAGVHVVVLESCDQSFAACQTLETKSRAEFFGDGALSVRYLNVQQSALLFAGGTR
jgi:hypothetical protein